MTESRDLQVEKNQEKSIQLKALRGAIDDLTVSRDGWKEKKRTLEEKLTQADSKLKEQDKEIERKNIEISELTETINKMECFLFKEKKEKEKDEELLRQQIDDLKKKYKGLAS